MDNTVIDLLNYRADYKVAEKILKPILKRNGSIIEKIKVIKDITEIIK